MRNLLTACLPALALFALGGCAGTSALTSSEDDGVYYSSKDRTTAVVQAAPAPAYASEEANPDYNGTAPAAAQQGSGSTQYYDNNYTYMRGVPGYGGTSAYYGSGLNGYAPYSPYTTLAYAPFGGICTGFGYGWGGGGCGYSPYAYGGGFDPFYGSPYGYGFSPYGYGSGVSISFGFGRPYYGGFGYSPYGYGYGLSPFYYGGPFYGGYYGRGGYGGGYYGNGYGGGGYYGGNGGYYGNGDNRNGGGRTYGPRTDRASEGRYSSATGSNGGATPAPGSTGGRARTQRPAGNGGQMGGGQLPDGADDGSRRSRREAASADNGGQSNGGYNNQPQRMDNGGRSRYRNMEAPVAADPNSGPVRIEGTQPQGQPAAPQQQEGRRRGGFFQNMPSAPAGNPGSGQVAEQPRQRSYEQPRQQTYEQPRQQSYEQPQRSYSQPSLPSYGGGGNSGSSSGDGGGGGRRGRD